MGDFNFQDLKKIIPKVFKEDKFKEAFIDIETAPGKGQLDHILYSKHWELESFEIQKGNSDHYMCVVNVDLIETKQGL